MRFALTGALAGSRSFLREAGKAAFRWTAAPPNTTRATLAGFPAARVFRREIRVDPQGDESGYGERMAQCFSPAAD